MHLPASTLAVIGAPKRGALLVNRHRARILGIELTDVTGVEEFVDKALPIEGAGL